MTPIGMNTSFIEVVKRVRLATNCDRCGKSTVAINVNALAGLSGYRAETVTKDSHCACAASGDMPAGPAYTPPIEIDRRIVSVVGGENEHDVGGDVA